MLVASSWSSAQGALGTPPAASLPERLGRSLSEVPGFRNGVGAEEGCSSGGTGQGGATQQLCVDWSDRGSPLWPWVLRVPRREPARPRARQHPTTIGPVRLRTARGIFRRPLRRRGSVLTGGAPSPDGAGVRRCQLRARPQRVCARGEPRRRARGRAAGGRGPSRGGGGRPDVAGVRRSHGGRSGCSESAE